MLFSQLYTAERFLSYSDVEKIAKECSNFVAESGGHPLIRYLDTTKYSSDICKIKLRHRSGQQAPQIIDTALNEETQNVSSRALHIDFSQPDDSSLKPFYVIPTNGYRFICHNSDSVSSLDEVATTSAIEDIAVEVVKMAAVNTSLCEAIQTKTELMFYNIPFCYAINCESTTYGTFINMVNLANSRGGSRGSF